jgi:hypothetical protein
MTFRIDADRLSQIVAPAIRLRCPGCRHDAVLKSYVESDLLLEPYGRQGTPYVVGLRYCPNPACQTHIFVAARPDGTVVTSYPPETIDFDATGLPEPVVSAFEEAVKAHAQQCYKAAAMMVRKTLEEVCADRGATGNTLKNRIETLASQVILPQPLLEGLDNLRLLGNDAAHVESRDFDKVDRKEVEVAIDVAKEILKATYQYQGLISELEALKRPVGEA